MQIKLALVVDDSKSARFSLKKLLERQDIQTDFAESAGDALNYLESRRPDVIFMDHLMPGMDGFDATRAIKKNAATADIPIIMCTSKDGSDYAEQAMAVGAVGILPKPAPEATLLAVLNQLGQAGSSVAGEADAKSTGGAAVNQRAVEAIVKKMLDEQVTVLRKQITESLQIQMRETIEQTLADVRAQYKRELSEAMEPLINASAQRHARQVAMDMFDQRFEELTQRLETPVNARLADFESTLESLRKPSPEVVSEIKTMAQFTAAAAAGEAAKATAGDVAQRAAEEVLKRESAALRTTLTKDVTKQLESAQASQRMLTLVAAALGAGGLVLAIIALVAG